MGEIRWDKSPYCDHEFDPRPSQPHDGARPQWRIDVVGIVEEALGALDELLGLRIPALLQISGGFRVRTSRTTRTH